VWSLYPRVEGGDSLVAPCANLAGIDAGEHGAVKLRIRGVEESTLLSDGRQDASPNSQT
jgi:hypothetical protein